MLKNKWIKRIVYCFIYMSLSCLTFYFFDSPTLLETAFAEELTSSDDPTLDKKILEEEKIQKTYSDILWGYRWYIFGASLVVIGVITTFFYFYSGSLPPVMPSLTPTPEPFLMPHIPGQTITDLIAVKPEVCIDRNFSSAMPDTLPVDSIFYHPVGNNVVDPYFIKGIKSGGEIFQVYLKIMRRVEPNKKKLF